eukprot:gene131-227_t
MPTMRVKRRIPKKPGEPSAKDAEKAPSSGTVSKESGESGNATSSVSKEPADPAANGASSSSSSSGADGSVSAKKGDPKRGVWFPIGKAGPSGALASKSGGSQNGPAGTVPAGAALIHTELDCRSAFPSDVGFTVKGAEIFVDTDSFLRAVLQFAEQQFHGATVRSMLGYTAGAGNGMAERMETWVLLLLPPPQKPGDSGEKSRVQMLSFKISDAHAEAAYEAAVKVVNEEAKRTKAVAACVVDEIWLENDCSGRESSSSGLISTILYSPALDEPFALARLIEPKRDDVKARELLQFASEVPPRDPKKGADLALYRQLSAQPYQLPLDGLETGLTSGLAKRFAKGSNYEIAEEGDSIVPGAGEADKVVEGEGGGEEEEDEEDLLPYCMPVNGGPTSQKMYGFGAMRSGGGPGLGNGAGGSASSSSSMGAAGRGQSSAPAGPSDTSSAAPECSAATESSSSSAPAPPKFVPQRTPKIFAILKQGDKAVSRSSTSTASADELCAAKLKDLLEKFPNQAFAVDEDGWTPLMHAAYSSRPWTAAAIVAGVKGAARASGSAAEAEADRRTLVNLINATEATRGHTALHLAALPVMGGWKRDFPAGAESSSPGRVEEVEPTSSGVESTNLREKSADVFEQKYEVAKLLLSHGAVLTRNQDGYAPQDYLLSRKTDASLLSASGGEKDSDSVSESGGGELQSFRQQLQSLLDAAVERAKKTCCAGQCEQCCPGGVCPVGEGPEANEAKADEKKELLRCSRCQMRWFASKECQREDWRTHKKVCFRPGALPPQPPMGTNPHTGAMRFF